MAGFRDLAKIRKFGVPEPGFFRGTFGAAAFSQKTLVVSQLFFEFLCSGQDSRLRPSACPRSPGIFASDLVLASGNPVPSQELLD